MAQGQSTSSGVGISHGRAAVVPIAPVKLTTLAMSLGLSLTAQTVCAQGLDAPMGSAWPATRTWNASYEQRFGRFVQRIGRAVAAGRCRHLSDCLNDASINPLHEPGARPLRFRADCADLPYVLRAWFAYRNRLPFAWTRAMTGRGRDPRYLLDARPSGTRLWTDFATPRALFEHIGEEVHSGYFRLAPELDAGDTYQTAVRRTAIRPGTVFYDPNGHVLMVYEVMADGEVRLFDAHPDNSISHPSLSPRQERGTARFGGGFRNFRPLSVHAGIARFTPNRQLREWGGRTQFDDTHHIVAGAPSDYHAWIRARLATAPRTLAAR